MRRAMRAHWPDEPFAQLQPLGMPVARTVRIGRQEFQAAGGSPALHLIDHALLRLDQRREFSEQHAPHGGQIALTLQHVREGAPDWS